MWFFFFHENGVEKIPTTLKQTDIAIKYSEKLVFLLSMWKEATLILPNSSTLEAK